MGVLVTTRIAVRIGLNCMLDLNFAVLLAVKYYNLILARYDR